MQVALAHDYFYALGGAEQTVAVMHGLWPEAPVYTSFVDHATFPLNFTGWELRTSFLQHVPHPARFQKILTPLYPLAFRSFDMQPFDVVVSSASFAAKGIPRRPNTLHISYCYTPPRFLWGMTPATDRAQMSWPVRGLDALLRPYLRRWDRWAAAQPHHLVAISNTVAARMRRIYGVEATVIYPPVATRRFHSQPHRDEGYYVYVGRLESHKRVDLAIAAAQAAQVPLRVIGDGPLRDQIARTAPPNVQILGWLPEQELIAQRRRVPRAALSGRRRLRHRDGRSAQRGQARDRLRRWRRYRNRAAGCKRRARAGTDGRRFAQALRAFDGRQFSPEVCRETAAQFDEAVFTHQFKAFVEQKWIEFAHTLPVSS